MATMGQAIYGAPPQGGGGGMGGGGMGGGGMGGGAYDASGGGGGTPTMPFGGGGNDYGFQPFNPGTGGYGDGGGGGGDAFGGDMQSMPLDEEDGDDRPLLEELGINFDHIKKKTAAVLWPNQPLGEDILEDEDFAGPLCICLALGFSLLLTGKVHFGYIYGIGAMGCIGLYCVLNLMTGQQQEGRGAHRGVDLMRVFSIQGYCLLPIALVAVVGIVFDLRGWLGTFLSMAAVFWCTFTSTRFFEQAMAMRRQRHLIAYPVFLLYACFALITVF